MPKHDEYIVVQEMAEVLNERFTIYAFMSLEERALPDARDGLKPSQRRLLMAMYDLGLTARAATEKCAKICGDTSGNYHPHGEAIIYPTMVRLAQPWSLRDTLIQGQGNFGNRDGDPPAAMRYTEAKLSPVGEAMLEDLSEDVVPYISTYNEKRKEPTVLPAMFPNLLVNGGSGIAVGWAFNMPSHNLKEVVEVIKAYVANPKITPEDIIKIMPGPDFPTAGKILGTEGVLDYYRTGRGSVEMEGVYEVKSSGRGNETIIVTELPYGASAEQLVLEINKLVEDEKIDGIVDLQNHSDKDGMSVEISLGRNANSSLVINGLLHHTSLRKSFPVNQTVLIDGKIAPDVGIIPIIKAFVDHRKSILEKKFQSELRKQEARIHIIEGLIKVAANIDRVIAIIREADNPEAAIQALSQAKGLMLSVLQAKAVIAITLGQLTKLEALKFQQEMQERQERVKWLNKVLADKKEIMQIITEEQTELARKFGTERLTKVRRREATTIETEDLIKDQQLVVMLTGEGYIKSMPSDTFKTQGRGGKGVIGGNEDTNIFVMFESGSKELVLFFTNKGLMYRRKAYEIPEGSRTGKGTHVSNLLNLEEGEFVTNMIGLKSLDQKGYLTIATRNGIAKRTEIAEYETNRQAGIVAIKLEDDDQVAFAMVTDGNQEIIICTKNGLCVRYLETVIPVQGRATKGSRALKLDEDDSIAQVFAVNKGSDAKMLVVTAAGNGKRTSISEISQFNSRYVKGVLVLARPAVKKQGGIAGACAIDSGDGLLIMTTKGKVIRVDADDIRETGRTATGVCVVKMDSGDTVSKIARLAKTEEANEA